jgi:preprotein translocase subunit SecA
MDYLREGIHLRGFAQIEPIVAYKNEAFELFSDLMNTIWSDFSRMIYNVQVEVQGNDGEQPAAPQYQPSGSSTTPGRVSYSGGAGAPAGASAIAAAAAEAGPGAALADPDDVDEAQLLPEPVQQRRVEDVEQTGRNEPCWCGSGKKFKKCHGQ